MNTCRVRGFRFNDSHIAPAHRCGVCGQFWHGEIECGNQGNIDRLKHLSRNDKLNENDYCDLKYCDYRWSHKRSAHHCSKCGERAHCVTDCPSVQQRSGGLFSSWRRRIWRSSMFYYGVRGRKKYMFPFQLVWDVLSGTDETPAMDH